MIIISVYGVTEGKALVVKHRPRRLQAGRQALLFDGSTYRRAEVIEVRPEPTHGWEVIVSGDCPAGAGWTIK